MSSRGTRKKRMTQSEVINYVAERTNLNRAQAKQFFEDLANLAVSEDSQWRRKSSSLDSANWFDPNVRRAKAETLQPAKQFKFRRRLLLSFA